MYRWGQVFHCAQNERPDPHLLFKGNFEQVDAVTLLDDQ
jgi:hypothetical protein